MIGALVSMMMMTLCYKSFFGVHVCMRGWGDAFVTRQSLSDPRAPRNQKINVRNHKWEEKVGGDSRYTLILWILLTHLII